ncbi:hypothetical protein RJ639_043996 [Escallonia herrerae]|uniref:Uncharacterized protein n=1 Tax=Escallonia herrerae TaxID=1293975 RepID=A0AA88VAU4_9ASTE|nr:hypothetical protein RJ639_019785 [Escallonia herrerae]KAK3023865.1 hypothetical protein RJ639_043996 [Escallonia herrerae]
MAGGKGEEEVTEIGKLQASSSTAMSNDSVGMVFYEVGKVGQRFVHGEESIPDRVWPVSRLKQPGFVKLPGHLWRPVVSSIQMSSSISCIKTHSSTAADNASPTQLYLTKGNRITTLGSETCGGSVNILNVSEPLQYSPSISVLRRRIHRITTFDSTVWTADCNSNGSRAVIGKYFTFAMKVRITEV